MTRIPVSFNEASLSALQVLALQEHRNIRQQVAWMIEQELEKQGLLEITPDQLTRQSTGFPIKDEGSPEEMKSQGGANVAD